MVPRNCIVPAPSCRLWERNRSWEFPVSIVICLGGGFIGDSLTIINQLTLNIWYIPCSELETTSLITALFVVVQLQKRFSSSLFNHHFTPFPPPRTTIRSFIPSVAVTSLSF